MSVGGDQPINYDHNMSAPGSHFVINDVDDGTEAIQPQVEGTATLDKDIGEWMDHAFIAQIAGIGQNPSIISRIFITNRSCAPVKPEFKVIYGGEAETVKDVINPMNAAQTVEIVPDSQNIYQVKEIIERAHAANPAIELNKVYAIEVTLPGIAEEFYIYAQSKKSDQTDQTNIPVYTTSSRN